MLIAEIFIESVKAETTQLQATVAELKTKQQQTEQNRKELCLKSKNVEQNLRKKMYTRLKGKIYEIKHKYLNNT